MKAKVGIEASKPGVADDEADEEDREPERAEEGEDHARDQDQRRDQRPQQDREDDRDHEQGQRHDHLQVALGRLVEVVLRSRCRRRRARWRRAPSPATASRISGTIASDDLVNGSWARTIAAVPIVPSVDLCGRGVADATPSTPCAAWAAAAICCLGHRAVLGLDQHRHRREHPGRERLLEQLEALDALDRLLEEGRGRVVDLEREQPERPGDEDADRHQQRRPRALRARGRRTAARRPASARRRARGRRRPSGGGARTRAGRRSSAAPAAG